MPLTEAQKKVRQKHFPGRRGFLPPDQMEVFRQLCAQAGCPLEDGVFKRPRHFPAPKDEAPDWMPDMSDAPRQRKNKRKPDSMYSYEGSGDEDTAHGEMDVATGTGPSSHMERGAGSAVDLSRYASVEADNTGHDRDKAAGGHYPGGYNEHNLEDKLQLLQRHAALGQHQSSNWGVSLNSLQKNVGQAHALASVAGHQVLDLGSQPKQENMTAEGAATTALGGSEQQQQIDGTALHDAATELTAALAATATATPAPATSKAGDPMNEQLDREPRTSGAAAAAAHAMQLEAPHTGTHPASTIGRGATTADLTTHPSYEEFQQQQQQQQQQEQHSQKQQQQAQLESPALRVSTDQVRLARPRGRPPSRGRGRGRGRGHLKIDCDLPAVGSPMHPVNSPGVNTHAAAGFPSSTPAYHHHAHALGYGGVAGFSAHGQSTLARLAHAATMAEGMGVRGDGSRPDDYYQVYSEYYAAQEAYQRLAANLSSNPLLQRVPEPEVPERLYGPAYACRAHDSTGMLAAAAAIDLMSPGAISTGLHRRKETTAAAARYPSAAADEASAGDVQGASLTSHLQDTMQLQPLVDPECLHDGTHSPDELAAAAALNAAAAARLRESTPPAPPAPAPAAADMAPAEAEAATVEGHHDDDSDNDGEEQDDDDGDDDDNDDGQEPTGNVVTAAPAAAVDAEHVSAGVAAAATAGRVAAGHEAVGSGQAVVSHGLEASSLQHHQGLFLDVPGVTLAQQPLLVSPSDFYV